MKVGLNTGLIVGAALAVTAGAALAQWHSGAPANLASGSVAANGVVANAGTASPVNPVTIPMAQATSAGPTDEEPAFLPDGGAKAPPPVVALPPKAGADGLMPPDEVNLVPVAMLVDLSSGRVLFARDEARPFLPASVTKTMTAFLAMEMIAEGKLSAQTHVLVGDAAWQAWHAKGSRMFLAQGQSVSVDDLLRGIMTVSANDGCIVLAEGVAGNVGNWVALMNAEAQRLGMNDSHFGTPNGWMDHGNTRISARDLVKLADAMITRYPEMYHRYVGHPGMTFNAITQPNHDPTLHQVEGADGIKTGFTNEAHYNFLGSAERGGRRLVVVIAGAPTSRARAQAAKALLEGGFSAYDNRPLLNAGATVGKAEVQGGAVDKVSLVTPRAYGATLAHGGRGAVAMRIIYEGPIEAPVAKGAQVAELEVRMGNETPTRLPLLAGEAVVRGNAMDRLRTGFTRLIHLAHR